MINQEHAIPEIDLDINQQVKALIKSILNESDSNAAKLQFLKEEILNGRHKIGSMLIANKLLEYAHLSETEVLI